MGRYGSTHRDDRLNKSIVRHCFLGVSVLQFGLAAALCFVPLFDLLGYEFCFAIGALSAATSVSLGAVLGVASRGARPPWLLAWGSAALHLLPAWAAITLNTVRVQNCDYTEGLIFFAAYPLTSSLYGATLGVALARLTRSKTRLIALVALAVIAPAILRVTELYRHPQIFVFDHQWGHFAGSLYDESVSLDVRTLWLRAVTLLRMLLALVLLRAFERRRGGAVIAIVAFSMLGAIGDAQLGRIAGYRLDRDAIESELSVVVRRPGLEIHLPADTDARTAENVADFHQFWIERLQRELAVKGPEIVRSYVYRDRAQKAALMGGRNTMVAKPWLDEIHVHGLELPHAVIPHELVHVMAGELGVWPFDVTAHLGFLIDMGIVEGLAEALTPPRGDYSLHQWVRALRVLDRAPDVRRLVAVTDFWRAPPRRAYTLMGSFIRYLLDTRGPEPIKALYADGDFGNALGDELDTVVKEWERFIDDHVLSEQERRAAEERFRVKSIFQRACVHEIAQLRSEARSAPPQQALSLYRRVASFLEHDPNARYDVAMAELAAGEESAFLQTSRALLESDRLGAARATQLEEQLGALQWQQGRLEPARASFQRVQRYPTSAGSARLQWVRLWALRQPEDLRRFMRQFLAGELSPVHAVLELDRQRRLRPSDPTLPYLLARQLHQAEDFDAAIELLTDMGKHPDPEIERERLRLIAEGLFREGELDGAADLFNALAFDHPRSGEAERLRARSAWLRWQLRNERSARR